MSILGTDSLADFLDLLCFHTFWYSILKHESKQIQAIWNSIQCRVKECLRDLMLSNLVNATFYVTEALALF